MRAPGESNLRISINLTAGTTFLSREELALAPYQGTATRSLLSIYVSPKSPRRVQRTQKKNDDHERERVKLSAHERYMSANVEIDESSRKPEQRRDELYRPLRVYVFFLFQKRGVPVARRIYYIYIYTYAHVARK